VSRKPVRDGVDISDNVLYPRPGKVQQAGWESPNRPAVSESYLRLIRIVIRILIVICRPPQSGRSFAATAAPISLASVAGSPRLQGPGHSAPDEFRRIRTPLILDRIDQRGFRQGQYASSAIRLMRSLLLITYFIKNKISPCPSTSSRPKSPQRPGF
jgi:hypothetical protein